MVIKPVKHVLGFWIESNFAAVCSNERHASAKLKRSLGFLNWINIEVLGLLREQEVLDVLLQLVILLVVTKILDLNNYFIL